MKNVYLGEEEGQPIVIKRLGHSEELSRVDEELCARAHRAAGCDVAQALRASLTHRSGTDWLSAYATNMSDLTACPTPRLMERIMDKYTEKIDAIQLSATEKMYLLTTLMVNPEPLMLQVCTKAIHSNGQSRDTHAVGMYTD